jgi:hypothetical protein
MGGALRKKFGAEMVVFGFAFNQGVFQAIEPGKGLHDFRVAAAPAGSLDRDLCGDWNSAVRIGSEGSA